MLLMALVALWLRSLVVWSTAKLQL